MAIEINEMMRLTFDDGYANVVVTYDCTVYEDGEPDFIGALISVVATNTSLTKTVYAKIWRSNGVAVVERTLLPGESQTYTGGGSVKTVQDIPRFALYE